MDGDHLQRSWLVTSCRKKPRRTAFNKRNLELVWGDKYEVDVEIPQAVDDYNFGKVGVDGADQLIAYLVSQLRCRHTWQPLMKFALNCIRSNSYAVQKAVDHFPLTQKKYLFEWIRTLMRRANMCGRMTRQSTTMTRTTPKRPRFRLSNKNPQLPVDRINSLLSHEEITVPRQGRCLYCRYLRMRAKINSPDAKDNELPRVARPSKKCLGCDVFLCRKCFDTYHQST